MFDVSFTELLLIGVVALVVIGPERLPKVARTVGHLLGRAQRYVSDVKSDIQREIDLDEMSKLKKQMDDAAHSLQASMRETAATLQEPLAEARDSLAEASASVEDLLDQARRETGAAPGGANTEAEARAAPAAGLAGPEAVPEAPGPEPASPDTGAPASGIPRGPAAAERSASEEERKTSGQADTPT